MKKIVIALILCLFAGPAFAQMWSCLPAACVPGSPNCSCTQVAQPATPLPMVTLAPAPVAPNCPALTGQLMSYWNPALGTCQIPAAPAVDPSYYVLQQQLLQQQIQRQQMQDWHEQWHAQHPGGGPGGH